MIQTQNVNSYMIERFSKTEKKAADFQLESHMQILKNLTTSSS